MLSAEERLSPEIIVTSSRGFNSDSDGLALVCKGLLNVGGIGILDLWDLLDHVDVTDLPVILH